MSIIDPEGLFNGDRLRCCSNTAQLHWPRLFLASDGFARLEINYARIIGRAYPTFHPHPSETELQSYFEEYSQNRLIFMFSANGQLWGQWDTRSELLPRYKTSADRRSPIPPEPQYSNWKHLYRVQSNSFPKTSGNISETFQHGVGVGVGIGVGIGVGVELGLATATSSPVEHSEYPKTIAAIREYDAAVDEGFVRALANKLTHSLLSHKTFPQDQIPRATTDAVIAKACRRSFDTGPPGHRTGLLLNRVPSIIATWGIEGGK